MAATRTSGGRRRRDRDLPAIGPVRRTLATGCSSVSIAPLTLRARASSFVPLGRIFADWATRSRSRAAAPSACSVSPFKSDHLHLIVEAERYASPHPVVYRPCDSLRASINRSDAQRPRLATGAIMPMPSAPSRDTIALVYVLLSRRTASAVRSRHVDPRQLRPLVRGLETSDDRPGRCPAQSLAAYVARHRRLAPRWITAIDRQEAPAARSLPSPPAKTTAVSEPARSYGWQATTAASSSGPSGCSWTVRRTSRTARRGTRCKR